MTIPSPPWSKERKNQNTSLPGRIFSYDGALKISKQKATLSTALMRKIRVQKFGFVLTAKGDETYLLHTDFSRTRTPSG